MKEKLLVAVVLLSLLTPLIPVSAAVLPGQEESGEGFWVNQKLNTPVSYSYSSANQVTKIDADNGIIIKDAFTTPQGNSYLNNASYKAQYIVNTDYTSYPSRVSLISKSGETIDIPDQYEFSNCIAVGIENEGNTRFLGCNPVTGEIVLGRIAKGQVKIQKKFQMNSTYISFGHEDFQGFNNVDGKHLAFSAYNANHTAEVFTLNIETGAVKNVTKQFTKAGYNTTMYSEAIGWRNNNLIVRGLFQSKESIYKYNVAQNTTDKVGDIYSAESGCVSDGANHALLNGYKSEDNNLYMVMPCVESNGKYSYTISKMNLGTGKIKMLASSKDIIEFSSPFFGKLSLSNNGNYVGVNTYNGMEPANSIYSLKLKTNTFVMIKYAASLL